jgi:hypothetical protein
VATWLKSSAATAPARCDGAANGSSLIDPERQHWLETLATACEQVLADLGADRRQAAVVEDVEKLLAGMRRELAEERSSSGQDAGPAASA